MKTALLPLFLLATTASGVRGERFVTWQSFPPSMRVMVAEGEQEPRSVGSYSVRVYQVHHPDHPMDHFVCGLVAARDGTVEKVILHDLDSDGEPEIIVTIRCVGTGSYLSAHAYRFQDHRLFRVGGFDDRAGDTDPIAALKTPPTTPAAAPAGD